jgi:DNA (cytosine-5)-methyltransferase 1
MIKHLELFSGIGGFRLALDLVASDFQIHSKCIGFSEIDKYATTTYNANFDTSKDVAMGDIVDFCSNPDNISSLEDFDILTGGFPCQPFSMMGAQNGFTDARGNVFFKIIDIIKIKKPKMILLENVKNLINHDKKQTLKKVIELISLEGYTVFYDIFNTSNFNLAQTRNRVFIFAIKDKPNKNFTFTENVVIEYSNKNVTNSKLLKQKDIFDVLEKNTDNKYYLSDVIKPTILSNGTKNFKSKSEINLKIARPLTATMVKMHRACQDNYYSDDFINKNYVDTNIQMNDLLKKKIRKLTPKEAFNLQGFDDQFFLNAKKAGISDHQLYKQAGNAVSVNTVYAILHYLINKFMN